MLDCRMIVLLSVQYPTVTLCLSVNVS